MTKVFNYVNGYGQFFINLSQTQAEMLAEIRKITPEAPDSARGYCVVLYGEAGEKAPWIYLNQSDIAGDDFVVEHEAGHCALRLMQIKDESFKKTRRLTRAREEDFLMLQGGITENIYEAIFEFGEEKENTP